MTRVFMTPDYRVDNPYQELLSRAFRHVDVEVVFPDGYKRVLPLFRGMRSCGGRFDVLHLHWLSPFIKRGLPSLVPVYALRTLLDLALCRLVLGSRIVWTVHNLASHEDANWSEVLFRKIVARWASHVVVHSRAAAERVQTAFGVSGAHLRVVPHGEYREWYGSEPSRVDARAALGIENSRRVFLFLGLLRPYKGLEQLLEAWRTLSPESAVLLIAGKALDPAYLDRLREAAGEAPGVVFRPEHIPDADIPMLLAAADVFVLPLQHILTSGSLILAQSYGLPIIAPAHPFVVETLGADLPSLFPPDSPHGLRDAIARSLMGTLTGPRLSGVPWCDVATATAAVYRN